MTPITGILKKPQTVEQSKGSSGIKYTFVARDGVFEREEESKNPAQPTLRWRMYTYSDGKFALLHFLGESETPSTILVWDGVNRIMVVPKARTTNTYPEPPHWGARQIGALISLDGVTERTDVQVDRAPLLIPPDYTERTPSETGKIWAAIEARTLGDCEKTRSWHDDAVYFSYQIKKAFVFERTLEVPSRPTLRYEAYPSGTIVRTEFIGTEVRTIIFDASHGLKRVLDTVSKSFQTYPWTAEDTMLWRGIVGIEESRKVFKVSNDSEEDAAAKVPDGYTERTPSETYLAYMRVTGQSPDERFLSNAKLRDASYKTGQEELAARNQSCTLPALQPVPKLPIQTP